MAFSIFVGYSEYADLDERVELLSEACDALKPMLPDLSTQTRGSLLGSTVLNVPKGRKIVEGAKLHLQMGRVTQETIVSINKTLGLMTSELAVANLDLCTCAVQVIDR